MCVRDPEIASLDAAIRSVKAQTYKNWQLCIVSNASRQERTRKYLRSIKGKKINVIFLKKRVKKGKALNEALRRTTGSYIALIDNSDLLAESALLRVAEAVNKKSPDLIYSDEDALTVDGKYINPHFKPNYSPDTILSYNYIGHLLVVKRTILKAAGGFPEKFEDALDYDLLLRCLEISPKVHHIPEILYHRNIHPNTEADAFKDPLFLLDEERKVLQAACDRRLIKASVLPGIHMGTYRVKRPIEGKPLVCIIIPFRDKPDFLKRCLDSILERTTYPHFNIIGINNDSKEPRTLRLMKEYEAKDKRIKFHKHSGPFNYSKINNCAVRLTEAEHIVLLNNDVEVITAEWIEALLEHSQRPDVGAVGAKLYYPDGKIQHAGVVIGIKGVAAIIPDISTGARSSRMSVL